MNFLTSCSSNLPLPCSPAVTRGMFLHQRDQNTQLMAGKHSSFFSCGPSWKPGGEKEHLKWLFSPKVALYAAPVFPLTCEHLSLFRWRKWYVSKETNRSTVIRYNSVLELNPLAVLKSKERVKKGFKLYIQSKFSPAYFELWRNVIY